MRLPQTVAAYDKALAALKGAGVELVAMDMHVLTELSERIMPDESLYTYEMPRELSRWELSRCLAAGCWSLGYVRV